MERDAYMERMTKLLTAYGNDVKQQRKKLEKAQKKEAKQTKGKNWGRAIGSTVGAIGGGIAGTFTGVGTVPGAMAGAALGGGLGSDAGGALATSNIKEGNWGDWSDFGSGTSMGIAQGMPSLAAGMAENGAAPSGSNAFADHKPGPYSPGMLNDPTTDPAFADMSGQPAYRQAPNYTNTFDPNQFRLRSQFGE